jgi:rare lipoprotein A
MTAGALCIATSCVAAEPAAARPDVQHQHPANIAVAVAKKRLHVRAGRPLKVVGSVQPLVAGVTARLQLWRRGAWRTIERDRTGGRGRYVLRDRVNRPMSAPAQVRVSWRRRKLGRLNVYRYAHASWYGPGLYGNRLGCGGTLMPGRLGVAHRTLPCGTRLTLRHHGRSVRVPVIDRGPYVGGRELDLTEATAQRLHFVGHGPILTTR